MMEQSTRKNLGNTKTWTRAIYIVVFAIAFNVAEFAIAAITVVQFFTVLFTGKGNQVLSKAGTEVGEYLSDVTAFLTYGSDHMPFPVSNWGQGPERKSSRGRGSSAKKTAAKKTAAKKTAAKKKSESESES